ncbi:O-antigen ligase family protein [Salibacter sp.]|uniref:O-antigen ligase family protein n=1 Tax=Salibacter sp. TaxID=2010995 RepID=UPI0028700DDC|nr:O-antigen ligase family protein [Salibacter sp.]MDR9487378.1 O-antigen ligase family protein [Salibacter sp.]
MLFGSKWHRIIDIIALSLLCVGLFFSKAFVSIGAITFAVNWFLKKDLLVRTKSFFTDRLAWILLIVFLLHVIGLSWTNDFDYALKDLRIKLPLLLFPIAFSTFMRLSDLETKIILGFFISSALVSTIISYNLYLTQYPDQISDIRNISKYISHIRFSLLIVMAIIFIAEGIRQRYILGKWRIIGALLILWFVYFLTVINVIGGFVALGLGALTALIYFTREASKKLAIFFWGAFIVLFIATGWWMFDTAKNYLTVKQDFDYSQEYTPYGDVYVTDLEDKRVENGYYITHFVAYGELRRTWEKRSDVPFDSLDAKGQRIEMTMKRFITSKGLKKDRDGVMALTDEEIKAIENGVASVRYMDASGIELRYLKILFEFNNYLEGFSPQGNSLTMRLEYMKTGWHIFTQNPLFGVGTGDVQASFDKAYDELNSPLKGDYRRRAHNQFLTFLITFGAIGFALVLFSFVAPFWSEPNARSLVYILFFVVAISSMLSEDTLETQVGVTFFAFFNSFLLQGLPRHFSNKDR